MQKLKESHTIASAVESLKMGDLVAFPTETVYGLGADAQNLRALEKLFALKGRPTNHPVIVHLSSFEQVESWCKIVSEQAKALAREFWPGPLTLIMPRSSKALDLVTGGQESVGIRIPSHPVAQELLQSFGDGIAAPSANKFGQLSPTSAEHVRFEFGDELSVILDGGNSQVGIESTIVDLSGQRPQILRPGMLDVAQIAKVLGVDNSKKLERFDDTVRASGGLPSHYAPRTPLRLVSADDLVAVISGASKRVEYEGSVAVLSFLDTPSSSHTDRNICQWIKAEQDPFEYARALYGDLRRLDGSGADVILVETLPTTIFWTAIMDRLVRAAH